MKMNTIQKSKTGRVYIKALPQCNHNPKIGDIVSTTTGDFPYCSVCNEFVSSDHFCDGVTYAIVEPHHQDYNDFDENRCNNGGGYGFDYFRIVKFISQEEFLKIRDILIFKNNYRMVDSTTIHHKGRINESPEQIEKITGYRPVKTLKKWGDNYHVMPNEFFKEYSLKKA